MLTLSEIRPAPSTASYPSNLALLVPKFKAALSDHVFFFDIDNCLYDIASGISDIMCKRISQYGIRVGIPESQVEEITLNYYKTYGLAIRGFIKHHKIDPIHYDLNVDQSVPLEEILKPCPKLRSMLKKLKVRRWAFTNANKPHADKVLKLLGISDLFEGVTYCDYSEPNFSCKPELPAFEKAMIEAKVAHPSLCYFADDSVKNLDTARELGWTTVHVTGSRNPGNNKSGPHRSLTYIHDLPSLLPHIFL